MSVQSLKTGLRGPYMACGLPSFYKDYLQENRILLIPDEQPRTRIDLRWQSSLPLLLHNVEAAPLTIGEQGTCFRQVKLFIAH